MSTSRVSLAFVEGVTGDNFYDTEACGAKQAAQAVGASIKVSGPGQYDPAQQASVVQTAVASGAQALLLAPTSPTVLEAPVRQAIAQGLKVIAVGNTLQDPSLAAGTVLSGNGAGGALAGLALARASHVRGPVLTLGVVAGNVAIGDRISGFEKAVSKDASLSVLPVQYDDNQPTQAASIVTSTLAAHPGLAGVFATDLPGLVGAAQALKSAGREGKVALVGYDASPTEAKLLRDGEAQALVAQPAKEEGAQAVNEALGALRGKRVAKVVILSNHLLTAKNLGHEMANIYTGAC